MVDLSLTFIYGVWVPMAYGVTWHYLPRAYAVWRAEGQFTELSVLMAGVAASAFGSGSMQAFFWLYRYARAMGWTALEQLLEASSMPFLFALFVIAGYTCHLWIQMRWKAFALLGGSAVASAIGMAITVALTAPDGWRSAAGL